MKNLLVLLAAALAAAPVFGADVNVSVTVGDPRYYGRIDIVGYPQPQLLYPEPVVIQPPPASVVVQPIYVRVPPGQGFPVDEIARAVARLRAEFVTVISARLRVVKEAVSG